MRRVLEPKLLDAIDAISGIPLDGIVWRVTWAKRDPIAGNYGGGRWTPSNSFEVLYTSLEESGAMAEAYFHLSRAPVFSSSHMLINQLQVSLTNVLRLSKIQLENLGIDEPFNF